MPTHPHICTLKSISLLVTEVSVLLVYGSDLYSGIDFMKCIIQSLMAFCMEVISPSPTLENKLSIASFGVWPWWMGCLQEKPRNSAHCIDTLNVCVFYVPICVLTLFFFPVQIVSPPLQYLNWTPWADISPVLDRLPRSHLDYGQLLLAPGCQSDLTNLSQDGGSSG